jgi:hypothetical protein
MRDCEHINIHNINTVKHTLKCSCEKNVETEASMKFIVSHTYAQVCMHGFIHIYTVRHKC